MPDESLIQRHRLGRLGLSTQRRLDVGIALSLFLTGTLTGLLYCLFYAGAPAYYQKWFGPAVMFASGQGFVNPDTTKAPKIQEFLDLKRHRLSRGDIPPDTPTVPLIGDQKVHRYLMLSVGFWWRLAGISWRQVDAVNAVLYGLATVSLYAIFRLAVRRTFAVLGALLVCFSATQLENLVHLRDYSKTPFILASLAIIGTIALRSLPRRWLLGLSALGGTILGIGMGFRSDVATMVPIFVFALLVFHADKPWHRLPDKLMALAIFVLGFAVFARPILAGASTGTNLSHAILLGLTDPFNGALGVNGSIYSFGHYYKDTYVFSAVGSYAERLHHITAFSPSTTYEQMGSEYLLALGRQFPADMLTRFFASVVAILELPFAVFLEYQLDPRVPFQALAVKLYRQMGMFNGVGVPLAVVLLAGMASRRLRYGLFATFILAALSGLSTLQFQLRHHFHLQFISILGLLLLVDSLLLVAGRVIGRWWGRPGSSSGIGHAPGRVSELWPRSWAEVATACRAEVTTVFRSVRTSGAAHPAVRAAGRALLMGLLIVSVTVLPLWGLRRYQERDVRQLFRAYLAAEKQEIHPVFATENPGRVQITWDGTSGRAFGPGYYPTDYYVMEVVGDEDLAIGAIGLRYAAISSFHDRSRTIQLQFRKGTNRIFFPVHGISGVLWFKGLEVGEGLRKHLRGIFRVTRVEETPLLLDVHLAPDWENERLFQTLRLWERPVPGKTTVYTAFQPGSASRHGWIGLSASATLNAAKLDVEWKNSTMVKSDGRRILVNGTATGRYHYLVQFKKVGLTEGALLLVRGRLERGGLGVGLLKDDTWYKYVTIDRPGEFVAAVEVDKTGVFVPMITNAIATPGRKRNRFTITEIGILDPKDSR